MLFYGLVVLTRDKRHRVQEMQQSEQILCSDYEEESDEDCGPVRPFGVCPRLVGMVEKEPGAKKIEGKDLEDEHAGIDTRAPRHC